ncbi:hypothetical protein EON67_00660 [archaeon]|nr:MAG: hypothetical protein EON67_00660 [archaeon]
MHALLTSVRCCRWTPATARCSVGASILLYGKVYTITGCTESTREWYRLVDEELGGTGDWEQAPNEDAPADPFTSTRTAVMVRALHGRGFARPTYALREPLL